MKTAFGTASLLLIWQLVAVPVALAHHSVAGQFDVTQILTLTGTVSKVDWMNPHIYIHLDVKAEDGQVATWRLESVPTAMARKAGLSKSMLMAGGMPVTVDIYPARDGTPHLGFILKMILPDGRYYQFSGDRRGESIQASDPKSGDSK